MSDTIYFYKDRPIFGLDIGASSAKFVQLNKQGNKCTIQGYGSAQYDKSYIAKGEIINFEGVANAIHKSFSEGIKGKVSTHRVIFSVPAAFTYSRIISLPNSLDIKDIPEAVNTETQQYLPTALSELYTDYSIIDSHDKERRVLTVAVPKKIIDSYMTLADILGLEVIAMEPSTGASNRLFDFTDQHKVPSVLIDFGAYSTDITVYDKSLVVTGTINKGGEDFVKTIEEKLSVTRTEAHTILTRYGFNVSKRQDEIRSGMKPFMDDLSKEVQRMVRYYEERVNDQKKKIGQIVTLGGGANLPGLTDYLTMMLRLPVRPYDPWSTILFDELKRPPVGEETIYVTAAGLALLKPEEPFL
ncbi:type IV pilus assembly protein PilM [Candidatus Saccharibacteria bacterium]|nr:type IV pilus assembly protein PilM [Candidatus Saccharibacteria bacterium]